MLGEPSGRMCTGRGKLLLRRDPAPRCLPLLRRRATSSACSGRRHTHHRSVKNASNHVLYVYYRCEASRQQAKQAVRTYPEPDLVSRGRNRKLSSNQVSCWCRTVVGSFSSISLSSLEAAELKLASEIAAAKPRENASKT